MSRENWCRCKSPRKLLRTLDRLCTFIVVIWQVHSYLRAASLFLLDLHLTARYRSNIDHHNTQMLLEQSHVQREAMLSRVAVGAILIPHMTVHFYSCCLSGKVLLSSITSVQSKPVSYGSLRLNALSKCTNICWRESKPKRSNATMNLCGCYLDYWGHCASSKFFLQRV